MLANFKVICGIIIFIFSSDFKVYFYYLQWIYNYPVLPSMMCNVSMILWRVNRLRILQDFFAS